jgi:hypothetical protein
MGKIRAVITADVVNSSLLSKAEMGSLKKTIEKILRKADMQFTFYRGDSFNILCDTTVALATVCLLRTLAIKSSDGPGGRYIDIRIALGIGIVEEPFRDLSTAKGSAFVLSGREMDQMEKLGPRLSIRCSDPAIDAGAAAVALLTDMIITGLTIRQATVVYELIRGATQMKVAKALHKSQSTINKHAHAAHWKELEQVLGIYQNLISLMPTKTPDNC